MVFLRSAASLEFGPVLKTKRLILRFPQMVDFAAWSDLREVSKEGLIPFEPKWAENELSRDNYRLRLRFYQREFRDSTGYPFFIFTKEGNQLVGGITLSNVRRGVTQSGSLGYWIGAPFQNHGFMTEAVKAVAHYALKELKLHRVDAASLPENLASIQVLKKCGFLEEGLAREYLCINGQWQDHILFGLLVKDYKEL
jgi:ribosomal-protein-alanine N-acetyltransferase